MGVLREGGGRQRVMREEGGLEEDRGARAQRVGVGFMNGWNPMHHDIHMNSNDACTHHLPQSAPFSFSVA